MPILFIILAMIFCHIVDDYYLQGALANLKQKSYWEKDAPNKMYQHDYIAALVMHSMSWSFMIMLPIAICNSFNVGVMFVITFVANAIVHGIVDDLKANKHRINLIQDQTCHLIQIAVTAVVMLIL